MIHRVPLFAALAALLLSACGGGKGGNEEIEAISNASKALDGYVTVDGFRDTVSGIRVGDQDHIAPARAVRGFISFNTPALPANAQVERANLRLYQDSPIGDPFDLLRVVLVDHVRYGISLDPTDYNIASVNDDIGTISNHEIPGFRTLDVTSLVIQEVLAGNPRIQFRLRLSGPESDTDGLQDIVLFEDGDNSRGTGNVPVLIIKYIEL